MRNNFIYYPVLFCIFIVMLNFNSVTVAILSAGKSTRMQAKKSKLLFKLHGKPVVCHVTDACRNAGIKDIILIVGHNADEIKRATGNKFKYALQDPPLGTGHAVMCARNQLLNDYDGAVVVLTGDAPFITPQVIRNLIQHHEENKAAATLLTTVFENPPPYGRVIRNRQGKVLRIVEDKDASESERAIKEVTTSHYCFDARQVLPLLDKISNHNAKQEYYLTDIVAILAKHKKKIVTLPVENPLLLVGINTRTDLQEAKKIK